MQDKKKVQEIKQFEHRGNDCKSVPKCLVGSPIRIPQLKSYFCYKATGKRDSYLQTIEETEAFPQDLNENPTTEDLVQSSGNSKEASTNSFFLTPEGIEEFLQDINETYDTRTPAAPEPELYVPLTARDEDSQKESIQNEVTSFQERNPTVASLMTDGSDIPKTLITDCQATDTNANKMTIPIEGSQMKTLNDDQSLYGGKITFSEDQTLYGGQMKSPSECQTLNEAQMTFSGDQTLYQGQIKTL